jgi:malonyl-CoA O-methyltransferase
MNAPAPLPLTTPTPTAKPGSTARRHVHAPAVARVLRRLATQPQAPWLHGEVGRRMAERLPVILRTPQAVLEWWSFLGGSGDALRAAYPKARRILVEPTGALQQRSSAMAPPPWWSARRWTQGGVQVVTEDAVAPACAQLLWSNMLLHFAVDPPTLMARWRHALAVDGFLMFSTLGPDTLAELRALYRDLGWPAPGSAFVDMHDLGDMLVEAGFADPVMDQEKLVLTWAEPQAMLDELRTLGGNTSPDRTPGLRTPRWKARLGDVLRERAGPDGRWAMSFEVVYGHAFNPPPRVRVAPLAQVALEDMRAMARAGRSPAR